MEESEPEMSCNSPEVTQSSERHGRDQSHIWLCRTLLAVRMHAGDCGSGIASASLRAFFSRVSSGWATLRLESGPLLTSLQAGQSYLPGHVLGNAGSEDTFLPWRSDQNIHPAFRAWGLALARFPGKDLYLPLQKLPLAQATRGAPVPAGD